MTRKQASPPAPTTPVRVGAAPRGAHPPHPERLWASNGWDRYQTRAARHRGWWMSGVVILGLAVLCWMALVLMMWMIVWIR